MVELNVVQENVVKFRDEALAEFSNYAKTNQKTLNKIQTATVEDFGMIEGVFNDIISIVSFSPDVQIPNFISTLKVVDIDGNVEKIEVIIKSKLNARHSKKFVISEYVRENFFQNLSEGVLGSVIDLTYTDLAVENVDELNEVLQGFYDEEEIAKRLYFEVSDVEGLVVDIDEDQVTLNMTVEDALSVGTTKYFSELEVVREQAFEQLGEALNSAISTPAIIKSKIDLVQLCTGGVNKRSDRFLRQTYRKKAENVSSKKGGVGYIISEVEGDKVFALVEKNADSDEYAIKLPAFNVSTNMYVDVDTLTLIEG